jgi:hypothetical protein
MTESGVCAYSACFSRSRNTGKERDTESGLDYFGAFKHQNLTINTRGPDRTFAIAHVHPGNGGNIWQASTPASNSPNNGKGDTGVADAYKLQYYIVSASGLGLYDPVLGGESSLLRPNLDWTQPCKKEYTMMARKTVFGPLIILRIALVGCVFTSCADPQATARKTYKVVKSSTYEKLLNQIFPQQEISCAQF